jgi:hypothetical protein
VRNTRHTDEGEVTSMRYLALALSFLMVFRCSTFSYSGRPVPVPKIETMPVSRTKGPITIGIDPCIQTDRQKEFDDDLAKEGVPPIYILVRNSGERSQPIFQSSKSTKFELIINLKAAKQIG